MFHGLTMVNFDGQTQNQMMVRPWSTMVDDGQPWSDGQTVAGAVILCACFILQWTTDLLKTVTSYWKLFTIELVVFCWWMVLSFKNN